MTESKAKSGPTQRPTFSQRFWAEVRGYAEALVIAFLVVTFLFNTVGVVGSSMQPNLDGGVGGGNLVQSLLTGDRVFIPKYETWLRRAGIMGEYQRGQIVVVREPANSPTAQERNRRPFFIKRVIAKPGDRLRIEGGQVYVNGHPIDQGYITDSGEIDPDPVDFPLVTQEDGEVTGMVVSFPTTMRGTPVPQLPGGMFRPEPVAVDDARIGLYYGDMLESLAPIPEDAPEGEPFVHDIVVPEGRYFVMGDNRQSSRGGSEDSRFFGPIEFMSIAGRASAVIWPPRRDGDWNWRSLGIPEAFDEIPAAQND